MKRVPMGSDRDLIDAHWVDLCDPDEQEVARIAEQFDLRVPSRAALAEIEASSRMRSDRGALYLSAPVMTRSDDGDDYLTPVGFILSADVLVTVRFTAMGPFEALHESIAKGQHLKSGAEALIRLLEEIVDRAADRFERAADAVNRASHEVFTLPKPGRKRSLGHETRRLRALMVEAGRTSEQLVRVRHSILSIKRISAYVADRCQPKLDQALIDRLASIRHDIDSIDEFEASLSGRVQLLLDAATGFISIEQNDVVKVLTVVSVAGVPPVLIAGIYGMNFKWMPELDWHWGYPYALALMVVTTVLPILWFKWRDWL